MQPPRIAWNEFTIKRPDALHYPRYGVHVIVKASYPPSKETAMTANVGNIDRIIRILAGIALIAWALMGGPVWAWIGVLPLATGLFRFCPAYSLLGINSCGLKQ